MIPQIRMLAVDPRALCAKHINGEHQSLHDFVSMFLKKGVKAIQPYLEGAVVMPSLAARHSALVAEQKRRGWPSGYHHETPLVQPAWPTDVPTGQVYRDADYARLSKTCPSCRIRQRFTVADALTELEDVELILDPVRLRELTAATLYGEDAYHQRQRVATILHPLLSEAKPQERTARLLNFDTLHADEYKVGVLSCVFAGLLS